MNVRDLFWEAVVVSVLAALVWTFVFVLPVMAIRGDLDHVGGLTWVRLSFLAPLGFGVGWAFRGRYPD